MDSFESAESGSAKPVRLGVLIGPCSVLKTDKPKWELWSILPHHLTVDWGRRLIGYLLNASHPSPNTPNPENPRRRRKPPTGGEEW